MEVCFPVAKVVAISSDNVDIEYWFVMFGHRATGKVMRIIHRAKVAKGSCLTSFE